MKNVAFCLTLLFTLAKAEPKKLQDIVVNAQKLEQKLLDVPISIDVYDDVRLEDLNIKAYEDLSGFSANFTILNPGSGISAPSIRGISTDTTMDATNVAIFVDGVPYIGNLATYIPMDNIGKIEILKGPQGTLYGKNAYAGVINITTKKPTNVTEAKTGITLGSDKMRELFANASGALIADKLYLSLSATHYEKDGFIRNLNTGRYENYEESNFGKIYLKLIPNENLKVSLITQHIKQNDGSPSMLPLVNGKVLSRATTSDFEGKSLPKIWNNSLKIDYNYQNYTLSSILTHRKYNDFSQYDADYTSTNKNMFHVINKMSKKEYSFESRFLARKENFTFLAGIYADDLQRYQDTKINKFGLMNAKISSNTYSFFANNDYSFNDKFSLTLGARYDYDKINLKDILTNTKDNDAHKEISPKIALKYKINPNFTTYANIAKGYRMGGYFLFAPQGYDKKYNPETMISYEAGLKSQFENFWLNTSVFFMDISDKQVTTYINETIGYVNNAAKAVSKGFEIEANYEISNGLSVFGNFGYANSQFKDFKDALGDYSKNQIPFASKYTYSLGAIYRDSSGFFITANTKTQSKIYDDKANLNKSNGFTLVNAKIGYESENFDIYLYGKNLTDKDYGFNYGTTRYLSSPREIGISFTYRYN